MQCLNLALLLVSPEEINVMALPFLHGDVSFKAQFWTLCRAVNVTLPLLLLILRK
jgi:hypothetical protein